MQRILLFFLATFARIIIKIHRPFVIGITGTVGKTTITHHISRFLAHEVWKENVEYSPYHYNGEYGLPLTIIGSETGGKNPFLWWVVFFRALKRCFGSFPKYLILEYGIDHPGEMDFLRSIVLPDIAIITEVLPNHIEQFWTFERYRSEKLKFIQGVEHIIAHESHREFIESEAIFYGRWAMSDIDASHVEIVPRGTQAQIHMQGSIYPLMLPVFWEFQIDNILPVYGVASILGLSLEHIAEYAKKFQPDSGRSWMLTAVGNALIVDGSYNGGYASIHAGIISMRSFLHSHKIIFVLWDMRELGTESKKLHEQIAQEIQDVFPSGVGVEFFLVWPMMGEFVFPLLREHYTVHHFLSSQDAWMSIRSLLEQKDDNSSTMIYVKWSQNTIFLEEAIKKILRDPNDVTKLCRQSEEWLARKTLFFDSLTKK